MAACSGGGPAEVRILAGPLVLLLALAACDGTGEAAAEDGGLTPTVTAERIPYSRTPFVRLVGADRACVIDSYEDRIECGGRSWEDVTHIGTEGEGPGEYDVLQGIAGAGRDRLALVDFGNLRVTFASLDGETLRTVPFEGEPWLVRSPADTVVRVTVSPPGQWVPSQQRLRRVVRIGRITPGTDSPEWLEFPVADSTLVADQPLVAGAFSPLHGYVFTVPPYRLARFSPRGEFLGAVTPDHYEPELPSERDVRSRVSDLTALFGRRPSESSMEAYRNRPKRGVLGIQHLAFDTDGLLWVATTRDRDRWSQLDVFAAGGARFLGSVRVRNRMLAFDVRDHTLVVLAESEARDGVPRLALDWYDVSRWIDSVGPGTVPGDRPTPRAPARPR